MLDPILIAALQTPPPPARPSMAEERAWQSPKAAELERFTKRQADGFDQYVEGWLRRIETNKAQLELMPIPYPMPPELLGLLTESIEDREAEAEARMIVISRAKKSIARDVKRMFSVDPSIAAVLRSFGARTTRTDERVVEALLDLALYLRALRAEGDPLSRDGETFDDPVALARHLESLPPA